VHAGRHDRRGDGTIYVAPGIAVKGIHTLHRDKRYLVCRRFPFFVKVMVSFEPLTYQQMRPLKRNKLVARRVRYVNTRDF
jgi:hypothetical protein